MNFWKKLSARERQLIGGMLLVVLLVFTWLFVLRPSLKLLREGPAAIAKFDRDLAQVRMQAEQLAVLKQAPRRSAPVDFANLVSSKAKAALGAGARITPGAGEVRAQADAVPAAAALALLQDVADSAQARAMELSLTNLGNGSVKFSVKWVPRQ